MSRVVWVGILLALSALILPSRAWALRCGNQIVKQGETAAQVLDACGAPFFLDRYVGGPGVGVTTPVELVAPAVVREVWYYNFGPQRLMVRLEFSGDVLARMQTLGYGFVGRGGPCDFTNVTIGMSVASLIARCGFPAARGRNPLATAVAMGSRAPAWGETWVYPGDASRATRAIHLQDGRVVDVRIVR
ncbi:MAG TPA: DUF2845 domain-containing protein [Rhodanobacteraceae bacterium]|nr:DUF2845 domain-containing protein [Rhodanobacteraceae bacterium]